MALEKYDRLKEYEVIVENWGKLSKACTFLGGIALSLEMRMLLSSGNRKGISCLRVLGLFQGRMVWRGRGTILFLPFLKLLLQLKIFSMPRCHILE